MGEKEKWLVTSYFSFSHNDFHSYISLVHQNTVLCGNGLTPNSKILYQSKLEAFADDKLEVAKMMTTVFDGAESIMGKGENAGCLHFLLFP